jgi:hypothetical protein
MNAPMLTGPQMSVLDAEGVPKGLSELLISMFEQASRFSDDPDEVARIATEATIRLLEQSRSVGGDC